MKSFINSRSSSLNVKNQLMKGSDVLVKRLEKNGVNTIFAYPGGCNIPIYNSLNKSKIQNVLCRHEQCGVFMAEGYAKSSGKIGVVCTTSGPGATNLVTGIVDAAIDSVPIVCISGQVNSTMIGIDSFQEVGFADMVNDYCKHVFKVNHVNQIARIVDEAFFLAQYGRPGPVVIDIPKDIQCQEIDYVEEHINMNINKHIRNSRKVITLNTYSKFCDMIKESRKPVFYLGGGCLDAKENIIEILKHINIPVVSTLMGLGVVSKYDTSLYLGMVGMHGTIAANFAVHDCDLLIAIGVRFDDRVTGKLETFAKNARIIHIDIDSKEIGKNKEVDLAICCDANKFLYDLSSILKISNFLFQVPEWTKQIESKTLSQQVVYEQGLLKKKFTGSHVISIINKVFTNLQISPIISTGVGQHQMFTAQHFTFKHPRSFLTSGGFGTMGFGLPAAIGAWHANKDKDRYIIDIDGDGSFLMNIQELATIVTEKIPIKIIIVNNQKLGMVSQWGDRFHKYSDYTFLGKKSNPIEIYPDFVSIAKAFGIKSKRVYDINELEISVIDMLDQDGPYLLDIVVDNSEVLPFIPANGNYDDIIVQ